MSINKGYSQAHPLTRCPQVFPLSGCYAHTTQPARQKLASAHPAGDLLTSGPRAGGQCFTSESSLLSSELQGSFPSGYPNQSLSLQGTPWVEHPRSACPDSSHGRGGQPWRGSPCHTSSVDDDDDGGDGGDDEGEGGNGKEEHQDTTKDSWTWLGLVINPVHPTPLL